MSRKTMLSLAVLASVSSFAIGCSKGGDSPEDLAGKTTPPVAVDFAKDVQPTLQTYCLPCHGEGGKGGLNVKSDAAKAMASKMVEELGAKKMPPKDAPKALPDEDRAKLIEQLKSLG